MALIISKEFKFEASHNLCWHEGKCKNLHGHSYVLIVSISGKRNKNDVVMDFGDVKDIVDKEVISILDHNHLNDVISNPTAENISIWIWDKLKSKLPLYEVLLMEGRYNTVRYTGEEDNE